MPTLSPHTVAPLAPATPAARRYYIMGAHSLPDGTAFAVADSQQHLLTQFAMGFLSVAEVVDLLTTKSAA